MPSKIGEYFAYIGIDHKAFAKGLSRSRKQFQGAVMSMEKVAAKAKLGLLLGAGAFGVATHAAASFEQGMNRVLALTSAGESDFAALSAQAKKLGATTMFSARQSADAMGNFALAGFDAKKIIGAMPATLDLAAAGQLDVATASDIAAKIMAGMGMEADELGHAVDVLAKAFTTSNTDLVQLGEAMKYVGPVAKTAGYSLEETAAAIQVLSNAGMQGGMAGTALRGIMSKLSGATPETTKVFKSLGVETKTAFGELRPLADIFDDLNAAMAGKGEGDKMMLMMKAFGQRAGPALLELLSQGGDAVRDYQRALEDAGGTAKRIADVQMRGLSGQITKLKSAFEGLLIAVGEKTLPFFTKLAERITSLASAMTESNDGIAKFVEVLVRLGSALAAVVIGAKLLSMVSALTAVGAAAGGPVTMGIMALATAVGVLATAWMRAKAKGESFGDALNAQIKLLGGYRNAIDEVMDSQNRFDKVKKESASERDMANDPTVVGSPAHVDAAKRSVKMNESLADQNERRVSDLNWWQARRQQGTITQGGWSQKDAKRRAAIRQREGMGGLFTDDATIATAAKGARADMSTSVRGVRNAKEYLAQAIAAQQQRTFKDLSKGGWTSLIPKQKTGMDAAMQSASNIASPYMNAGQKMIDTIKLRMSDKSSPIVNALGNSLMSGLGTTLTGIGVSAAQAGGGMTRAAAKKALAPPEPMRQSQIMAAADFAKHIQTSLKPKNPMDKERNKQLIDINAGVKATVTTLKGLARSAGGLLQ